MAAPVSTTLPACTLQANKAQLSAAVASQVEATKSGLDMLTRAYQVTGRLWLAACCGSGAAGFDTSNPTRVPAPPAAGAGPDAGALP